MYLRKVFDDKNFVRLENVEGDSVTVYIEGTNAYILSVMVSFLKRGMARGTELMSAMEGCLSDKGVKIINASYASELLNVNDLLYVCDFSIMEGMPVLSFDAKKVLMTPDMIKAAKKGKGSELFVPLSKLNAVQTGKFLYQMEGLFKPLPKTYLAGFSQNESGVVFDEKNRLAAAILCTRYGDSMHIDYFLLTSEEAAKYAKPLLAGFIYRLFRTYEDEPFENITMIPMGKTEYNMIKACFGETKGEERPISVFAFKKLSAPQKTFEIREDPITQELFMQLWEREVATVPYQFNIFLKSIKK